MDPLLTSGSNPPVERSVRNYKLIEQIGTGGMGVIWRAVQTTLDRPVAIKELHPHLAKDRDFIERFEREAKSAAALDHENIVRVIDFGREDDGSFLAMEYVDGTDLKVLLAQQPTVVAPVAVQIALEILRGIGAAHAKGIVHRDLKPANVMLTKDGVTKIADFSIAFSANTPSLTATGSTPGTPAYMSPEQAGGNTRLDARSDLFSVGVILYEMLAGRKPFLGETYGQMVGQVLHVDPPPLATVSTGVPDAVIRCVKRALEKDVSRRWVTAADFQRELEAAARNAGVAHGRDLVASFVAAPKAFDTDFRRKLAEGPTGPRPVVAGPARARAPETSGILEPSGHRDRAPGGARKLLLGAALAIGALAIGGGLVSGMRALAARDVERKVAEITKNDGEEAALNYLNAELARRPGMTAGVRLRVELEATLEARKRLKEQRNGYAADLGNYARAHAEPEVPWAIATEFDRDLVPETLSYFHWLAIDRDLRDGGRRGYREHPRVLARAWEALARVRPDSEYGRGVHDLLRAFYEKERAAWAAAHLDAGTGLEWLNAMAILEDRKDPRAEDPERVALRALLRGEATEVEVERLAASADLAKVKRWTDVLISVKEEQELPTRAQPLVEHAIGRLEARFAERAD